MSVSWTSSYLDLGTTQNAIPAQNRNGAATLVPADGSASPTGTQITFGTAFPNSVSGVQIGLQNYSGTDNASLGYRIVGNPTTSGFYIVVTGGAVGKTVTVTYTAEGT